MIIRKKHIALIASCILLIAGCRTIHKSASKKQRHELYIDYKTTYYKTKTEDKQLVLTIDSIGDIWYKGKLRINATDTILVNGFAKGNHYVTLYTCKKKMTQCRLEIWAYGQEHKPVDSLSIKDVDSCILKEEYILYLVKQ